MTPDAGKVAAPPDVIRWTPRDGDAPDCAVAALEIACGVTYQAALAAAALVAPDVNERGLSWAEIRRAARRLGWRTRLLRRGQFDVCDEDASGVLSVFRRHDKVRTDHVVYLWGGRVVEPSFSRRALWRNPEDFLRHYGYATGSLLVMEERL